MVLGLIWGAQAVPRSLDRPYAIRNRFDAELVATALMVESFTMAIRRRMGGQLTYTERQQLYVEAGRTIRLASGVQRAIANTVRRKSVCAQ